MMKPDCEAFAKDPKGFPTDPEGDLAADGEIRNIPLKTPGYIMQVRFSAPRAPTPSQNGHIAPDENEECLIKMEKPIFERLAQQGVPTNPPKSVYLRCKRCAHNTTCHLLSHPSP